MAQATMPARAPAAVQQAARRTPFRYGTRQRFAQVPIQSGSTYAAGGSFFAELPRVGFLSHILIRLTGTMNLGTNGGALTTRGPWDLLARILVRTNIGSAVLYDTTGYGNYVVQRIMARPLDVGDAADADLYSAGVAQGNNTWTLTYVLPIAENYGPQFALGLINLQSPELQVTVEGTYGTEASVVSNVNNGFSGALAIGYLFYEVPDPREVLYPPVVFHRIIEQRQVISAVGDQIYTVPREGIVHRLVHVVQQNDARTNNVSRIQVRFNRTDYPYVLDRWQLKMLHRLWYSDPLPTGVFSLDWWAAEGLPAQGDNRDMVSSEDLSTLETIVTTTGSLGGSLNALDVIREFAQFVRR
jgi:hypothetical protein